LVVQRSPSERPRDATTQGDASRCGREQPEDAWGIFWVSPEVRFDELGHGSTFGRAGDCSFLLDGPRVSRRHARLERDGPVWLLRDLDSRNGSFLNAQRRQVFPLSGQDTLRIGDWVGVVCRLRRGAKGREELFTELAPDLILSAPTIDGLPDLVSVARSDIPVIIEGETGTGKEGMAAEIHRQSGRSGPLIALNCAAIPESLAEAQLFGHTRGAFTGAQAASKGHLASADGGTLFLDEIAELPLRLQSKLLRAIEERTVTPLGSSQAMPVDFRLVAASQEPLQKLVDTGAFRADLYARLNGTELKLPPLRERRQEVLLLLRRFMGGSLAPAPELDSRLVERLCSYGWPYNIRELRQLGRLLAASAQTNYGLDDLPERFREDPTEPARSRPGSGAEDAAPDRRQAWLSRRAAELDRLQRALHASGGNMSEAARQAGIPLHRARRLLAAAAHLSEH
jgi:DNA-binding NtrC family response regulator